MTLDEAVLEDAKQARGRLVDLESQADHARIDYQHAIRKLHAAGGSLREIADALGLSHQRVHQIVEGPPPGMPGPFMIGAHGPPMRPFRRRGRNRPFFARFDAAARQVMVEAQQEADSLKHGYVGTEHMLLALLRRGTGGKLGVTVDAARAEVVQRVGEGPEEVPPGMPRPFTPRAKRAMEAALAEAAAADRERIAPEDLLIAIASDPKGMGAEVLEALGVTPERLREQLDR